MGKDLWDASREAMKLTDDQKAKLSDAWKQNGALWKELGEKV